jgi:PAS domain S-box-containing protein
MDGLNDDERVLAWLVSWHPSFDGKAIVNPDFTFRSVNHQFCKILGVTAAELVDKKFTDMTPEPLKTLEQQNAKLVMTGAQESYLLPKTYEFPSGRRVDVTLLVNGVYHKETGEFLFFVSTIMERIKMSATAVPSPQQTGLLDWVDKKKAGVSIATAIGLGLAYAVEKLLR